jgi:hypothetical protein
MINKKSFWLTGAWLAHPPHEHDTQPDRDLIRVRATMLFKSKDEGHGREHYDFIGGLKRTLMHPLRMISSFMSTLAGARTRRQLELV